MQLEMQQTSTRPVRSRGRNTIKELRQIMVGLAFIFPWIIGFVAFTLYPVLASVYYSMTEYSLFRPPRWVGTFNYVELFTEDPKFLISLGNTLYYVLLSTPIALFVAVGLAMLLNASVRGQAFFRTLFYLPVIVPAVASAVIWRWILNPQYGLLNAALALLGIRGPGWLGSPVWSKPSLILMSTWATGNAIVIYLAGLQDIPRTLYEAAELDGANWLDKIRYVTIPSLTPVIFFNVVISIINGFQYFTEAYVITKGVGGPMDSTLFYALYLYRNAFEYIRMGYASAMAWVLFVIVLFCTIIIMRSSERWVHYASL